jgi:hypothetical protein
VDRAPVPPFAGAQRDGSVPGQSNDRLHCPGQASAQSERATLPSIGFSTAPPGMQGVCPLCNSPTIFGPSEATRPGEPEISLPRADMRCILLNELLKGFAEATGAQWQQGCRRPVFTKIFSVSRSRKLHWPALRALDARPVIVVGPRETKSAREPAASPRRGS